MNCSTTTCQAGTLANATSTWLRTQLPARAWMQLISIIATDPGLIRNIATSEIVEGAASANAMNVILVKAIEATGVANDGTIDALDIRDINAYIRANYLQRMG